MDSFRPPQQKWIQSTKKTSMSDDDDLSDEWGAADIDLDDNVEIGTPLNSEQDNQEANYHNDEYWKEEHFQQVSEAKVLPPAAPKDLGEPMLIVDLTLLTNGAIHSKFDRNSVNDPAGVSQWRQRLAVGSSGVTSNPEHLADGTVRPCGSSVWREALVRLRDERPGHFFLPVFPSKK